MRLRPPHREERALDRRLCGPLLADLRAVHMDGNGLRIRLPQGFDAGARDVASALRVILRALPGADDDEPAVPAAADVGEDVVEARGPSLAGETLDDRALAPRERLWELLVVEQRDDRHVG